VNSSTPTGPAEAAGSPPLRGVGRGGGTGASARPVCVGEINTRFVDTLVGMRAEEIPLRLQKIRRQARGSVTVIEREGGRERGHGYTHPGSVNDGPSPRRMVFVHRGREEFV